MNEDETQAADQFKALLSESMIAGAEAASVQQIHAAEAQAWDIYVSRIVEVILRRVAPSVGRIDPSELVASTVAIADALLEERRKRFNIESHRASLLAAKPAKAELRSIR